MTNQTTKTVCSTLKGKIICSKVTSNINGNWVEITLEDELSHIEVISIKMNFEEFGAMLANNGYQKCEFKYNNSDKIGKKMEIKRIKLPKVGNCDKNKQILQTKKDALPYEIDGWQADVDAAYKVQQPNEHLEVICRRFIEV